MTYLLYILIGCIQFWSSSGLRAQPVKHDTLRSSLKATLSSVGLDAEGREIPISHLDVEEYVSTIMTPLLNYIFFDENSSEIPARYNRIPEENIDTFTIDHIHSADKISTYRHILNIIGARMSANPSSFLTITGCNEDIRSEKNNMKLSRARAEGVRKYLSAVWEINPNRLIIRTRNLSSKAVTPGTPEADAENRRVELESNDPLIFAPVITTDTLRIPDPPVIRFKASVSNEAGISHWILTTKQETLKLKEFDGRGRLPETIDWRIDRGSMPKLSGEMAAELTLIDSQFHTVIASGTLPIHRITVKKKREDRCNDTLINFFSLILFDAGSSEISPANQQVIQIINNYIKPLSVVRVYGYTDRIGESAYNQQISDRRAQAVASVLQTKNISSRGFGQDDLYDATFPEGRLYSRTVEVMIETPITN